jgi:outer membrane receptor for ferrienterochelin and colicins
MIDHVVVTGTRTERTLKDSPVLTQVITAKEIEKTGAKDLQGVLTNEIPGIEFSHMGYGADVTIQGLGAKYILFLIDGERIAGETNGNIDYSMINPDNIERIEFLKGTASTLYGSNAIGGVVNIITKEAKNQWNIDASVRYGQMNRDDFKSKDYKNALYPHFKKLYDNLDLPNVNANFGLGYRKANFFTNTNLNYKTVDGYTLENNSAELSDLNVDGLKDYKIVQKLGYDNGTFRAVLNASYYDHNQYVRPGGSLNRPGGSLNPKVFYDFKHGATTSYTYSDNLKMNLIYTNDNYKKYDVIIEDEKLEYENNLISLRYSLNTTISNHTLTGGAEYLREILTTDMFENSVDLNSKNFSDPVIFIQDEYQPFEELSLNAGFRLGYHSTYETHFTPNISAKYDVDKFSFRFLVGRGYKSPTLKELYMDWDHLGMFQILGNEELVPETSNEFTFSTEYTNSEYDFSTSITATYLDIDDAISSISGIRQIDNPDLPGGVENQDYMRYVNLQKVYKKNISLLLRKKLFSGFSIKGTVSYSHRNNKKDSSRPFSSTTQVEYDYKMDNYRINVLLSGNYKGKIEYYDDNDNKIEYSDYSMWRLSFNQIIFKNYKLNLGVDNLFNYQPKEHRFITGANPGRRAYVKVGYTF